MSTKLHLFKLSRTEEAISSINASISSLETFLNDHSQEQLAKSKLILIENSCINIKKAIKAYENSTLEKKIRREQIESALYGGKVTNGKELKELESESGFLFTQIGELEEKQIEKLTDLETEESQLRKGLNELEELIAESKKLNQNAINEIDSQKKRLLDLNMEKETIINQIEKEYLSRYFNLKTKKGGRAISEVVDNACSVCGAELPPSERQKARLQDTFSYCPSCGRLLYSG